MIYSILCTQPPTPGMMVKSNRCEGSQDGGRPQQSSGGEQKFSTKRPVMAGWSQAADGDTGLAG